MRCPQKAWKSASRIQLLIYLAMNYGEGKTITGAEVMRDMKSFGIGHSSFYTSIEIMFEEGLIELDPNDKRSNPFVVTECGSICAQCIRDRQIGHDYVCELALV